MDELKVRIQSLITDIETILPSLHLESTEKEIADITLEQQQPDFWSDNIVAQKRMQQLSKLTQKVQPWRAVEAEAKELMDLVNLTDVTLLDDISKQLLVAEQKYNELKKQLQYSGPYDEHDVILSVYAGAGGTDAQDWAQMLMRMYLRWAEQHNVKATVIQESAGEEAGIKSVTLELSGSLVYGKLKGEHGVHRLVRLSPFNSDNLRQTSFAKVDILPKIDTPDEVVIDDKELKVDVYRAGGHGGQSVNTTDSAVRVTHLPTGISIAIQNERSQLQNKETAMTILRSRLAQLQLEQHADKLSELKGPNEQAAWGNQIRNYVLHPYSMVKDSRTKYETSDVTGVLDGKIDDLIEAYLEYATTNNQ